MKAFYYDKKFVGIVDDCSSPGDLFGLDPDEDLTEFVDIPARLPPCRDKAIADFTLILSQSNMGDVLDGAVIDAKCREASILNNAYEDQIEYLLEQIGGDSIQAIIDVNDNE